MRFLVSSCSAPLHVTMLKLLGWMFLYDIRHTLVVLQPLQYMPVVFLLFRLLSGQLSLFVLHLCMGGGIRGQVTWGEEGTLMLAPELMSLFQ